MKCGQCKLEFNDGEECVSIVYAEFVQNGASGPTWGDASDDFYIHATCLLAYATQEQELNVTGEEA